MDTTTVAQRLKRAERDEARRTVLREAVARFNHELMDDEERLEVLARIKKLQKILAS